jgi:site-specific DNA-methyltransferase (adenine-specific)
MSESTNLFNEQSDENDNQARHIPVVNRSPLSLVFNEDCKAVMKRFSDGHFDLAVVDPPYGVKRDKGFEGFGGFGKPIARKQYEGSWDEATPDQEYFNELFRISKHQIIWGGNFFTDKLPVNGHWIFWDKINTMPTFGDGELAWTSFPLKSVRQVTIEYNGLLGKEIDRIHATQKPVKLYDWILAKYAKPGFKIFDSHLGSGSSRIACEKAGLDFVGCDNDEKIFNLQEKRFKDHLVQGRLFNADFC